MKAAPVVHHQDLMMDDQRDGQSGADGASKRDVRIAIIGAGFSGLGMAIRLKQAGIEDFLVLERAEEVGGTWHYNTYPGCQCDVPSHLYSFSFALNPDWSRTYSGQPEIWEYLRGCANEHGVKPHLRMGHEVLAAAWDEGEEIWRLETSRGEFTAKFVVMAPGGLAEPKLPEIPGLDEFEGATFHSAQWDHDFDLSGKRVAVVGTGASAIQIVPKIQPEVEQLHVFQRTPPWVVPHSDRPVTSLERWVYRALPFTQRLVRAGVYWMRETLVFGMVRNRRLLRPMQRWASRHMRRQVPDRELRRKLRPDYTIGCKRILPSNGWYPALTQPNVELVTDGIGEMRGSAIVSEDGTEREVDAIVFATGFYVTEMPSAARVRGRDGMVLGEVWDGSPQAYLGSTVAGFPNLFLMIGPNTGLGHNSIVFMAESQIAYVMDCLRVVEERGLETVEVRADVQRAYNEELQEGLKDTVWTAGGCSSWYIDAKGRCTTIWPDFTWRFRRRLRRFDPESYVLRNGTPGSPDSGVQSESAVREAA
jgi:cation diffusion facilitator CzcD-associated flavoprotein CzcO